MMSAPAPLRVVGWSLHVPGPPAATALAEVGHVRSPWAAYEAPAAESAKVVLGRKGLLYKEPATRLALCAVHRALGLPDGRRADHPLDPGTAVVVASNLGNVATVATVARTVRDDGTGAVSVLDAPNVSSNVVASTVALWFGFGGPNLMLCSGAESGRQALALAALLLRTERARRVVVVGVEPADEVATALHAAGDGQPPLRAGAACLVLEAWHQSAGHEPTDGAVRVEQAPSACPWPRSPRLLIGPDGLDLAARWGSFFGAHTIVGLALAAHLAVDEGRQVVAVAQDGAPPLVVSVAGTGCAADGCAADADGIDGGPGTGGAGGDGSRGGMA